MYNYILKQNIEEIKQKYWHNYKEGVENRRLLICIDRTLILSFIET